MKRILPILIFLCQSWCSEASSPPVRPPPYISRPVISLDYLHVMGPIWFIRVEVRDDSGPLPPGYSVLWTHRGGGMRALDLTGHPQHGNFDLITMYVIDGHDLQIGAIEFSGLWASFANPIEEFQEAGTSIGLPR